MHDIDVLHNAFEKLGIEFTKNIVKVSRGDNKQEFELIRIEESRDLDIAFYFTRDGKYVKNEFFVAW